MMARKRLTERFPWLLPLRKRQRIFCFYRAMRRDGSRYCAQQTTERLPVCLFTSRCPMYNTQTGFPMVYQENKVHNLKLAARQLDGLLIEPGETFSFWNRVRYADRETPYRDALNGAERPPDDGLRRRPVSDHQPALLGLSPHPGDIRRAPWAQQKGLPRAAQRRAPGRGRHRRRGLDGFQSPQRHGHLPAAICHLLRGGNYRRRLRRPGPRPRLPCRQPQPSLPAGGTTAAGGSRYRPPAQRSRPGPDRLSQLLPDQLSPPRPVRRSDSKQKRSLDHEREENDCRRLWRLFPGI